MDQWRAKGEARTGPDRWARGGENWNTKGIVRMLGWKKRDEGFEWQHYVRTTIKLRREARRDKAQELGRQAAKGARLAGAAAGNMARSSAAGLISGLRAALEKAGDLAVAGLGLAGLALGFGARRAVAALAPLLDLLGRPGVGGPLVFVGSLALLASQVRTWLAPGLFDQEAKGALAIACLCLLLGLGPALWLGHSRIGAHLEARRRSLAPLLQNRKRVAAVLAGCLTLAAVGTYALRLPGLALPSLPKLGSLPSLPFAAARVVEGSATVLAADMLSIEDAKVRLAGIVVPAAEQRCWRRDNRQWRCGVTARETTARLVRRHKVRCEVASAGSDGVAGGRCVVGEQDIAAALVRGGYAFSETGIAPPYASLEREAREASAGIWASAKPERPAEWRTRVWDEAKQQAPDGCPIKGRVSRGSRTYVLPWHARYGRIRVNTRRGERWFCSEAEAVAAGWRSEPRG